jgi:Cd2+/Zn2+-exporting ATPase
VHLPEFVGCFPRVYTPAVVAGAVVLAVVPPVIGDLFGEYFYRVLALLIMTCPCNLFGRLD